MKLTLLTMLSISLISSFGFATDYPKDAVPGKCYTRVIVPAKHKYVKEKVLTKAASKKVYMTQPKYRFVDKLVVTQEASHKLVIVPATYKTVQERVQIAGETRKLVPVKASYKQVAKKVLVRPAEKYWKKGAGPNQKVDEQTGEIHCLVERPAVYKTVYENVLVKSASTKEVVIPAQYKTIEKKVVDVAAHTKKVLIPEKKGLVRVRELVEPAQQRVEDIPATYKMITKRVTVQESRPEWSSILCKTNANRGVMREVQLSLKNNGYDPKAVDGIYGSDTHAAIEKFQKDKGLAVGYVTQETLNALNVKHTL